MFKAFEIETSTVCNLRCPLCPVSAMPRPKALMPEALFRKAVDELADMGFGGVFSPHFYNEPFADPRLFEFMAYAARKLPKARFVIFTNATLLTPQRFRDMRQCCPVDEYVVSIDQPVIERAVSTLLAQLAPDERKSVRTRRLSDGYLSNRSGLVANIEGLVRPGRCLIPGDYMVVNAHGDVVLCYNDYQGQNTFGNIAAAGISEIWHSPPYGKRRTEIAAGDFRLPMCRDCRLSESVACDTPRP